MSLLIPPPPSVYTYHLSAGTGTYITALSQSELPILELATFHPGVPLPIKVFETYSAQQP